MAGIIKKDVWYYVLCTALMGPFPLLLTFQDGMTAGTTALLALFPVSERFFRLSRGYLVVVGNLSLLIVAMILYVVYRLGLLGLTKLASTVMSLAIGLLFIAGQFGGLRWARQGLREEDLHRLAELASGLNLFLICCAGLALFFGIMAASVKTKASREV